MGNPDLDAPAHVVEKLKETIGKPRTDRYSASKGIPGLRRAQAAYYARRFGVKVDPERQVVATLGSKEGFANVAQAITAPGDVILVPNPSYPIHAFGFLMAGAAIRSVPCEPGPEFFHALERAVAHSIPSPLALVLCYPSNPTACVADLDFYRDVVAFARMLMADGVAPNGTRLLSQTSVRAMHEMNVVCPRHMNIDAIGLATFMWDWDDDGVYETFGHDGSTIGQAAWLRYHPESGTVVALLTNGGDGKGLAHDLLRDIFGAQAGLAPPDVPAPDEALKLDPAPYLGAYARGAAIVEIVADGPHLVARHRPTAESALVQGTFDVPLKPVDAELLVGTQPGYTLPMTYHFLDRDAAGRPRFLHQGVRAHRREGM
jgi:hypothetical protein